MQDRVMRDPETADTTMRLIRWVAARWSHQEFNLAALLLDAAKRHIEAGRHDEALAALDEAIDIGGRNVRKKPLRFAPNLAGGLALKAHLLAELDRLGEALSPIEGAIGIYRTLAPGDPERFEPVLLIALTSLGTWRLHRREFAQALPAYQQAVDLSRRLPSVSEADRSVALNNVAAALQGLGRHEEALPPAEEAVGIRRRLVREDPQRYTQNLVNSLRNLEQILSALGRYVEAIGIADELSVLTSSSRAAADGEPGPA